jgi:hypothetical protein
MGCFNSKDASGVDRKVKVKKPSPWKSQEPITHSGLKKLRDEFWDTCKHYGGEPVIWDALKGAIDVDRESAKLILEAADVIIEKQDLSVCYDQKGRKYELPVYILSEPVNILEDED